MEDFMDNFSDPARYFGYTPTSTAITLGEVSDISQLIQFDKITLWISFFSFAFAPTYWNTIGQVEYKTKIFTKLFCGFNYLACYVLAFTIFVLGLQRDFVFNLALSDQPFLTDLASHPVNQLFCILLFCFGTTLVLSSFWRLGITGTYLGDHFGILMDEMVVGFPFNACQNPMYFGTVLNLLASSLYQGSVAGVFLTIWAQIVYYIAVQYFEGPFTTFIYEEKERKENKKQ